MNTILVEQCARLACAVYNDGKIAVPEWTVIDKSDVCHAIAYQWAQNEKKVIIAFRGTSDIEDIVSDIDLLANIEDSVFFSAFSFYRHLKNLLPEDYTIYLTGHSLGGAIAAFCAFYARHTGLCSRVRAWVFNAVPIQGLIQRYYPDSPVDNIDFIENYDDPYDIVSHVLDKRQLGSCHHFLKNPGGEAWNIFMHHSMAHMLNSIKPS